MLDYVLNLLFLMVTNQILSYFDWNKLLIINSFPPSLILYTSYTDCFSFLFGISITFIYFCFNIFFLCFRELVFRGKNMSKAIKQQLQRQQGQYFQSFRRPNKEAQSTELYTHIREQCNRKKSIESETKSQENKDLTRDIKSKQLVRQTPVAIIESKVKPPKDNKAKSHSQEVDLIRTLSEIEDPYCNESGEVKDFRIYQNGQVNEFFEIKELKKATKVSDICLVNDHYILVKMPDNVKEQETNDNLIHAARRRQEFRALKENQERISANESIDRGKKLCRYLRSKRNRITRIEPIREEPEEVSDLDNKSIKTQSKLICLKMPSCWQANEQEMETYETRTTICNSLQNTKSKDIPAAEIGGTVKPLKKQERIDNFKNQGIQTISGSLLKSSLQYQVTLHNYGVLVDSQNNNNTLEINSAPRRRKSPRFESFYWLLRPFRGKYRKPKPKIQAVVYKTYFVKWTKPPDTLSHGYGVRPSRAAEVEVSVLRRCRSAIF